MPGIIHYIRIASLALTLCVTACTDRHDGEDRTAKDQVVLRFGPQANREVRTKAAGPADDENRVESIDMLVFDPEGNTLLHLQPAMEWDGTVYRATVTVPSASGPHKLYLVANHPMAVGSIHNVDALMRETESKRDADGSVTPPYTMSTDLIVLDKLSAGAIEDALKSSDNIFSLKRNVSKFTIENTAAGFTLGDAAWINTPVSAAVAENPAYATATDPTRYRRNRSESIYLYKQAVFNSDANRAFHLLVRGSYKGKEYFYKLRLFNPDGTPFTRIERNCHYKVTVTAVSGIGMANEEQAVKNGFSNDLQAVVQKEIDSPLDTYRNISVQAGYQLGFSCTDWTIYRDAITAPMQIGHAYRLIRDAALTGYTTFDPYNAATADGADATSPQTILQVQEAESGRVVSGEITCNDAVDKVYEMTLSFKDLPGKNEEYGFSCRFRYGVLFQELTVNRHPALDATYHVLPMLNTFYGEVADYESHDWINLSEQRHEDTNMKKAVVETDNDNIFIHVEKNTTGIAREGMVRCVGGNGYYEVRIMQK